MRVQVLSIEPNVDKGKFTVTVSLNSERYVFSMMVRTFRIIDREVQVASGDQHFGDLFQWNSDVQEQIYKLVLQLYNDMTVHFPVHLGEL